MGVYKRIKAKLVKAIIFIAAIYFFITLLFLFGNEKGAKIFDNIKKYTLPVEVKKDQEGGKHQMLVRELKKVGNLICYEGKYNYLYIDEETKWYGSKNISANLIYNFGLGIDFSTIKIELNGNKIIARIPEDRIEISYIELENKESTLKYFNSIFMEKYDINEIQRDCRDNVKLEILASEEYFHEAVNSIKERIREIGKQFGYNNIEFK